MQSTTFASFRKDTKKYIDNVIDSNEALLINRGKAPAVVILSLAEYNSMLATLHELTSTTNMQRLDSAIQKISKRQSIEKKFLIESALVMNESMRVLHEFDQIENAPCSTMEINNLKRNPKSTVREGWEQAFKQMHANGDDQLLNPDVLEDDTFDPW